MEQSAEIRSALQRARRALSEILSGHPDCGVRAGEILAALVEIEESLAAAGTNDGTGAKLGVGDARRRNKVKRYSVARAGSEEYLEEYRADHPFPFRCPKTVFDATVAAIADAEAPTAFDEIKARVRNALGEVPPDYHLRVCLRFLTGGATALVQRQRARYSCSRPRSLRRKGAAAWRAARSTGLE